MQERLRERLVVSGEAQERRRWRCRVGAAVECPGPGERREWGVGAVGESVEGGDEFGVVGESLSEGAGGRADVEGEVPCLVVVGEVAW